VFQVKIHFDIVRAAPEIVSMETGKTAILMICNNQIHSGRGREHEMVVVVRNFRTPGVDDNRQSILAK
jgi:hypothetical protein